MTRAYGIISARETAKRQEKPCTWRTAMYHYSNVQISLKDFRQLIDMNLKGSNSWGEKA